MKKIVLFVLCGIIFADVNFSKSEDPPEIIGTMFIPVMAKKRRTFRGRM